MFPARLTHALQQMRVIEAVRQRGRKGSRVCRRHEIAGAPGRNRSLHFANGRSHNGESGLNGFMRSYTKSFGSRWLNIKMLGSEEGAWITDKTRELEIF